jgi:hypothetical protein
MSNVFVDKNKIDLLANAISAKSGESLTLTLDEMVEAVDGIDTSGGGITPTGNIDISSAGVTDVTNYATATVPSADPWLEITTAFSGSGNNRTWTATPKVLVEVAEGDTAGFMADGYEKSGTLPLRFNTVPSNTTITPTTSSQTIGGTNYMMEGAVTVSAMPTMTLPSSTSATSSGTSKATITPSSSVQYLNIPTGYNGTAQYYTISASGGGSSKNVQVLQSTSRVNASSLTKALGDLTVSKTGTYDIYWSGGRSNTSSSYTWGTMLYVDDSGYGTENTSWTNNVQSNHLSNVSLTANQKLSVYSRGRLGNYYTFVPMLVIIES